MTLVGQGLSLPWLVHVLGVSEDAVIDALRAQYEHRASHLEELTSENDNEDGAAEQELLEHRLIRRAVSDAERAAVLRLRQNGAIDDQAWRRIDRDLDLEALRMDA